MNKKLITQIWNERRSNLVLLVELLLVSVVLWFVVDQLYARYRVNTQHLGFDVSHTYLLSVGEISSRSRLYEEASDEWSKNCEDMGRLLDRISHDPEVEVAGLSRNSYPYNFFNLSDWLNYDTITSKRLIMRLVSPDFIKVFRYQGTHGETPEQLADLLKGKVMMLSGKVFDKEGIASEQLRGQCIQIGTDSVCSRVVAVLKTVRYDDYYNMSYDGSFLLPLEGTPPYSDLTVRVKPEKEKDFLSRMEKEIAEYRFGNFFIKKIQSFEEIRNIFHKDEDTEQKLYYAIMGFLLLNVFISLLGVFVFRTRQRRKEIAIQIAMGSTRRQVFSRLLSEGVCLLMFATLPALAVDYYVAKEKLWGSTYGFPFEYSTFAITAGITFLLIAVTILVSIWFPARRASAIPPAETLHEG